jgi:hypothetical protein
MVFVGDDGYFLEGSDASTKLVEVDLASGQTIHTVALPNVVMLTTDQSRSQIVTMTSDDTVVARGLDLSPRGPSWRPAASGDLVHDAELSPDGRRLAIAQGSEVLIYDMATQTLAMPPLSAGDDTVVEVSWSPNSQLLAGSPMPPDHGGKAVDPLQVWQVGSLNWTSEVCGWADGGLSQSDWTRYVGSDTPYVNLCAGMSS